ncbi:S8 family serine peptidase [Nocardioides plantarum]|uniref:S8 family serine peptidase n=1 Tax=Nocardioides plantarum TaxID=29299 RepID=UPI00361F3301
MSRGTRRWRTRGALGALAAVSLTSVLVVGATGPALAAPDGNDCTGVNDVTTEKDPATARSAPLQALQISQAQNIVERVTGARRAGAGVHVAVVDSGVDDTGITVDVGLGGKGLKYYHGTAMAGVIAGQPQRGVGLVGIAPGATVYDARFYDTVNSEDGVTPTEARLVDALRAMLPRWAAARVRSASSPSRSPSTRARPGSGPRSRR